MALQGVEQSLEAGQRRLRPCQAAGKPEALDQLWRRGAHVRASLPQGPEHQLLAGTELPHDHLGKFRHVRAPAGVDDMRFDT